MTAHPIDTEALRRSARLSLVPGERVELSGMDMLALLDRLDAAEHRATRAEARVKAVQDVLAHHPYGGPGQEDAIRRALGNDHPPSA